MEGSNMKRSKQEIRSLFVNRPLMVAGSFFVMAACGLSIAAGPAFASPADRAWTADDLVKEKVGNTVDVATAAYTNTIGDALLMAYWKDPDFDAEEHAFYYVRVLEIPTPRWTTYDAVFFGIDLPNTVPATLQDRAYTSPIWYTPGG
jgi:hypothetical protein